MGESGAKLGEHDERQRDALGLFEKGDGFGDALAEIDVPIGVEGDVHFQRSSSIRSCAASAASAPLSGFQVPAISSR